MNRSMTKGRSRGHRADHAVRGAVQDAVTVAHHTRPAAGTQAGDHAVWWARTAGALDLLAEHEADPVRAEAARVDAGTAHRLAEGMAAAHSARVASVEPGTESGTAHVPLDEASLRIGGPLVGKTAYLGPASDPPDAAAMDDYYLEAGI